MHPSYRYFENKACKYYPCHADIDHINCLFCYCPLYTQENCPGTYRYLNTERAIPHLVLSVLKEEDLFDSVKKL